MKKLLIPFLILFLFSPVQAQNAKPVPYGSGIFAELGEDADFADITVNSITANDMYVARTPEEGTEYTYTIAATENDYYRKTDSDAFSYTRTYGEIGATLGNYGINIGRMQVGQEEDGDRNIIFLTTDTPIPPEVAEEMRHLSLVKSVITLEF